jgi:hypothetical protein
MDNNTSLIKQPYAITMAKHRLNIHEFRIMTRVIQALQPNMVYGKDRSSIQHTLLGDVILHLPTKELLPEGSDNYSAVKRSLKLLEQKTINVSGKDSRGEYETHARLIMKSKYYLNNHMVEIQLDRDLLPDMFALARNYSQYLAEVAFNSSSPYVARLYIFFSHWKDKTKKTVMLDTLRDWLDLDSKYENSKDFRKRILEPASAELKKRADIWFEIDSPIKVGRSITGYVFKIFKRGGNNPILDSAHTQNIRHILRELFDLGDYHLRQLESIINRPDLHAHIHEKIQEISQHIRKGNVKHIKSYVVKSLKNEFDTYEVE